MLTTPPHTPTPSQLLDSWLVPTSERDPLHTHHSWTRFLILLPLPMCHSEVTMRHLGHGPNLCIFKVKLAQWQLNSQSFLLIIILETFRFLCSWLENGELYHCTWKGFFMRFQVFHPGNVFYRCGIRQTFKLQNKDGIFRKKRATYFSQNCQKDKILRQLQDLEVEKTILCNYSCKFKCIPGQFIVLGKISSLFLSSVSLPFLWVLPLHIYNSPSDLQQCH